MSLEGSVLYKNEGFTALKNGKPNPGAFRGVLDESLDTLKLAEIYERHEDEIGYPYLDGKKRFCRAVVNLSFNRAVKVYESYGNRYVLNGYRVTDEDMQRRMAYACYTVWYCYTCKTTAIIECIHAYTRYAR